MKQLLLFLALFSCIAMGAQQLEISSTDTVEIGHILTIGKPSGTYYKHIRFPRPNFIRKKGGTPNFKRLKGIQVQVINKEQKDGKTKLTIKRKDGKQFFNSFRMVTVDLKPALETKEILRIN